ncbi:MAG: glycoside hydrolase family 20 zincin-like fold domain-containing protein, partial [Candidatus Marinimicrobia bacterium]|nr:glycoside hydrolase family 20 zincin-like fold domain-containing protein [Candidatus Neomarinimicrobiota bacterium]
MRKKRNPVHHIKLYRLSGILLGLLLIFPFWVNSTEILSINPASSSAQSDYAVRMLRQALEESGYSIANQSAEFDIHLVIDTVRLSSEAFNIVSNKNQITITGGDGRGLIYGALALAEDIRNGIRINEIKAREETAKLPFRAIKFDLPWDT